MTELTGEDLYAAILTIELYLVVIAVDVLLAWVQDDPRRIPRRLTLILTDPVQRPIRLLWSRLAPGRLDISPLVLIVVLGLVRVLLVRA